nr:immunoglobulin heavy chain junction region [Macaca mulatta]MOY21468.1 immunoglobulin heavy chain junction region [Macaca mulatta]MOY21716.1 immunoglobulin heavy chain junction region [Macaca mulatta]MOY21950.1 immunoglobulin heavy chain junction region [Macaca mulatta]MOY22089.1 immunoglobulin heavy chain junction region [Macaca mulatta]
CANGGIAAAGFDYL